MVDPLTLEYVERLAWPLEWTEEPENEHVSTAPSAVGGTYLIKSKAEDGDSMIHILSGCPTLGPEKIDPEIELEYARFPDATLAASNAEESAVRDALSSPAFGFPDITVLWSFDNEAVAIVGRVEGLEPFEITRNEQGTFSIDGGVVQTLSKAASTLYSSAASAIEQAREAIDPVPEPDPPTHYDLHFDIAPPSHTAENAGSIETMAGTIEAFDASGNGIAVERFKTNTSPSGPPVSIKVKAPAEWATATIRAWIDPSIPDHADPSPTHTATISRADADSLPGLSPLEKTGREPRLICPPVSAFRFVAHVPAGEDLAGGAPEAPQDATEGEGEPGAFRVGQQVKTPQGVGEFVRVDPASGNVIVRVGVRELSYPPARIS